MNALPPQELFDVFQKFIGYVKTNRSGKYTQRVAGLNIGAGFGIGRLSRVPWFGFFAENQTAQCGIYPVCLYYKKNDLFIVSYGISETTPPPITWGSKIIGKTTVAKELERRNISSSYKKQNNKTQIMYGDSFVKSCFNNILSIDNVNNTTFEEIYLNISEIIDEYHESLSGIRPMKEVTNSDNETKDDSARFAQQTVRDAFRAWLSAHNPEWKNGTVTMHYSDAYYLYNNKCDITLEEALTADDGLQRAYDVIERFYTDNPTQTNTPSGSARSYLRSLRMLKEFLDENYPELLDANSEVVSTPRVPDAVVEALSKNYASGFRFDTTYINLLSSASGVEIDAQIQLALKRMMFRRDDDIYFLLDIVTDAATRKGIIDFADSYLEEYGCFEISTFYKLHEDKVNPNCIRNADDFESFYEQIGKSGVRCVQAPHIGNRIARYSNGAVWTTFKEVAEKIVTVITDEYYGSCNEDDLHTKFCAFSTDLLGKIIKQCAADELIRVKINDSVCYQTFDALGLPDNFSEVLAKVLERLDDIGLEAAQNALHTVISLSLGVNFMKEFNLPDWETFRRLIAAFYKAEPRREWQSNIFGEATD